MNTPLTIKNINKFKDALTRPIIEFSKKFNIPEEFNTTIYVFKNENVEFYTSNLKLAEQIKQTFNQPFTRCDFGNLEFNLNLKHSLFVNDETLDGYWMPELFTNSMSLVLTNSPESLKQFASIFVKTHIDEFEGVYKNPINTEKDLPTLELSLTVNKDGFTDTFSTEEDVKNSEKTMLEFIDNATNQDKKSDGMNKN